MGTARAWTKSSLWPVREVNCQDCFDRFLDDFGRCLGGLISILNPDAVVLGGSLSNIKELCTIGRERVRKYAFHDNIDTPILENRLGDSAGVFGAAWIGQGHEGRECRAD